MAEPPAKTLSPRARLARFLAFALSCAILTVLAAPLFLIGNEGWGAWDFVGARDPSFFMAAVGGAMVAISLGCRVYLARGPTGGITVAVLAMWLVACLVVLPNVLRPPLDGPRDAAIIGALILFVAVPAWIVVGLSVHLAVRLSLWPGRSAGPRAIGVETERK